MSSEINECHIYKPGSTFYMQPRRGGMLLAPRGRYRIGHVIDNFNITINLLHIVERATERTRVRRNNADSSNTDGFIKMSVNNL